MIIWTPMIMDTDYRSQTIELWPLLPVAASGCRLVTLNNYTISQKFPSGIEVTCRKVSCIAANAIDIKWPVSQTFRNFDYEP